jgi:peptidyl-prolyl cis-trans isomerase SurA
MKKLCLLLIALSCLSALAAAQGGQVVEEIVTRVNGQIITHAEFDRSKDTLKDECKTQDAANPDKCFADKEKDILRDLIDQQLLIEKGKDLSINGDTDLIKRLDQMRKEMKLDSLAGNLLRRFQAEHAEPDHHTEGNRRRSWRPSQHHQRRDPAVLR